eukprot:1541712-Amphidinium_carterae.1
MEVGTASAFCGRSRYMLECATHTAIRIQALPISSVVDLLMMTVLIHQLRLLIWLSCSLWSCLCLLLLIA